MSRHPIPGGRDVTATLDEPASDATGDGVAQLDATACAVACPPHPEYGGSRSDRRLRAVADALCERGVACLRFDYGPWDEGRGERRDAENCLAWAAERFERVGLFGYSFGAGVALRAAAEGDPEPTAVSVLAPPADAADALDALKCPVQVIYGERDDTVDWRPVVERARELGFAVEGVPTDHHFVGQCERIGDLTATFLADALA